MTDFLASWQLSRSRFLESLSGLTAEQANWRIQPGTLTAAEMALHVAGVEAYFSLQIAGKEAEGAQVRLIKAATQGVVNDLPFPFDVAEMTPEFMAEMLEESRKLVQPLLEDPDPHRQATLVSALGPMITGEAAFARLAFHAAYHQGQVHFIRTAPGFPA